MKFVSRDSLIRLVAQIKKALLGKQDSDLVVVYNGETADKTFAEIAEAYNAGRRVFVNLGGAFLLPLASFQDDSAFFCLTANYDQIYAEVTSYNGTDTWTFGLKELVGTDNIKTVNGNSLVGEGYVTLNGSNLQYDGDETYNLVNGETIDANLDILDRTAHTLDENKVGYKEYATISAMQADATQPNGTIGFVSARHRFYIYHSLFEEWLMIAQGTSPSNEQFPYAFDIVLS